jgi:hypothetical protein
MSGNKLSDSFNSLIKHSTPHTVEYRSHYQGNKKTGYKPQVLLAKVTLRKIVFDIWLIILLVSPH